MIKEQFKKISDFLWELPPSARKDMRVPARLYTSPKLLEKVEERALEQLVNITTLPGIVGYAIAMPDIHTGYGPPIGGVGALRYPQGVISPGFVGFDENCGVRLLKSDYQASDLKDTLEKLALEIKKTVPAGLGKGHKENLSFEKIDNILAGGVPFLSQEGYASQADVDHCEEKGKMPEANPLAVSRQAKSRGSSQLGTLGSGNHFIEIQKVSQIFNKKAADTFGLFPEEVVIMVHTGSRGLGHQNCSDYLKLAGRTLSKYKINLPDKELAAFPADSLEGKKFFQAMSAASNFAWANRQMITFYIRKAWQKIFGQEKGLNLLYDVAHNIAKKEEHNINGQKEMLLVHRKGATRAFPPGHPDIPDAYQYVGQPVLIPGSMGTHSYVCLGTEKSKEAWYTVNHGAGRLMSRHAAVRNFNPGEIIKRLAVKHILISARPTKGIAEEAPAAYKDIEEVINVVRGAGLAEVVAQLTPLAVIKGE